MMDKYWLKIMTCHEEKTYVLAMALAGTLIGVMLFYFVLHRPLAAAADDYVRQAAESTQEITAISNFQNAHLQMKEYRTELAKREQRIMQYLPEKMAQGEFIQSLERLALQNKVKLQMVSPQKSISDGDSLCLPIKIKLTGGYFGLLKFIQGLQDGERLAVVNHMEITAKEAVLDVEMLVHIYAVPAK